MANPVTHDPYDICACAQLRKTARALTQYYDDALRPSGLKVTQFSVLRILAGQGPTTMTALADRMDLDRTTLTRNLGPLKREGLVETVPGQDSRSRLVRLTRKGQENLAGAEALWRDTQRHIIGSLGPGNAMKIFGDLAVMSDLTQT